jgi:hypothetical protein
MKAKKPNPEDPFFGLKYIAYLRTGLSVNTEDIDAEGLVNFARWQICKVRNILWNDAIWEKYTPEEILIEYFAIKFDENDTERKTFEATIVTGKETDIDWMMRSEAKYLKQQAPNNDTIKEELSPAEKAEVPETPRDFEDTF